MVSSNHFLDEFELAWASWFVGLMQIAGAAVVPVIHSTMKTIWFYSYGA